MRILLKNGLLMDGTGTPAVRGSLAIENDRIIDMGVIAESGFDTVIDVTGAVIAPGFIDTHSHSDLYVFKEPMLLPKIMQGITTETFGQDGTSMSPLPPAHISAWKKNLAGLEGINEDLDWAIFETTKSYLDALEQNGSAPNLCYLVPQGNIRMAGVGLENRQATPAEMKQMEALLDKELGSGAFALSSGLIYIPNGYGDSVELTAMCRVAAKHDVPLVIHQRSEANDILESMDEVLNAGRDSGARVHFSHFKICGKNNAHKLDAVLGKLDAAQKEGLRVSFDQYPYVAGSTMLGVILPPWAHAGGTDKLITRLASVSDRERMKKDIVDGIPGWDNFVHFAGFDGIFITDVASDRNRDSLGKNLIELGEMRGKEPLEAALDLLLDEENAVSMVDFYGLEEHVKTFIARPEMNVCTDGLLFNDSPHPRAYGAFPRVLGKYARDEKVIRMEEAVRKMTGKAAEALRIPERGLLKKGYYADVTVFNPETVIDKGTYTEPKQYPDGIMHVMVNGSLVVSKGLPVKGALPGKVLRKI